MFRGWYEHLVDAKGRVSIPSSYRDALNGQGEDRLIITTSISTRYLVAYPMSKWQAFEERVRELPQFNPDVERFRRVYIGGAMECSIDKQGRILLPANLRDFAGIGKELVFAGDIEKFQLWSKDAWAQAREADRDKLEDVQRTVSNLGL